MKLNVNASAGAVAIVTAALVTLCALFFALAPEAALSAFGMLFHAKPAGVAVDLNWGIYLGGLAVWTAGAWIATAVAAKLYNRLARG